MKTTLILILSTLWRSPKKHFFTPLFLMVAWSGTSTAQTATSYAVAAWGDSESVGMTVPVAAQSEVTAIAAGKRHIVALKNDGSVVALLNNNIYAWTPKAPMTMFHCQDDRDVVFANAEAAYQSLTNRGACCVSVVDPDAPAQLNHDDCYAPSLRAVLEWFETLRH